MILFYTINLGLLVIGSILIYVSIQSSCPPPKVEYRFVPRTFEEQMASPVQPSEIFKDMFEKPTPYVGGGSLGVGKARTLTSDNLNDFFISQD